MTASAPRIVLCFPGNWAEETDIMNAVAQKSDGYLLAGKVLVELEGDRSYPLSIEPHQPQLVDRFKAAGRGRLDETILKGIENHSYCLYLEHRGGSPGVAREVMVASIAILDAGGLAVKVESSDVAHSPSAW